jgi:dolichol kinase
VRLHVIGGAKISATSLGSLDELVNSTRGLQPWRKVFHAFNGIVIASGLTFLGLSKVEALAIIGAIGAILLIVDAVRLLNPDANAIFFRSFASLASPRDAEGLASSTWYTFGVLLTVALVPRPEAVSAILVLGLADPIASVVGQKYGRRPFLGGTVEGTTTFLVVALALLLARHAWPTALVAAALAGIAERRSWPLDDNFTIPVVTGLALFGVTLLV